MIDILFIHPNSSKKVYQGLAKNHSAIEPPIWAGMLTNACINKGFSAELLDCEVHDYSDLYVTYEIQYLKPRLICIVVYGQQPSASTQNMSGSVELAEKIKQRCDIPIIFVGGHIAAVHEEVLEKHNCVDFICQNEGVYTILNLVGCYRSTKNNPSFADLHAINGLGFRPTSFGIDGTKIILNTPSSFVRQEHLERDLPNLNWSVFPNLNKYRTSGWHAFSNQGDKSPFAAIYTSLGCPRICSFCAINTINRTTLGEYSTQDSPLFRYWNPEFIIKQFDYLAKNNIRNIKIADELFVLKPQHFLKLCNLIIEKKYDFNIWCYGRVDTTKQKYLDTLKKAGVNFIGLGIESVNQKVRRNVSKGKFEDLIIEQVIKDVENAGINVGANYIFGLPKDTHESMQETLDFAIDKCTVMANLYAIQAYPGSKLYQNTKNNYPGLLPTTYSGYAQHSYDCTPLASKNLSATEILDFRDKAWMKYHKNPKYLKLVLEKFGQKAYNSIVDACKIDLKRKILE